MTVVPLAPSTGGRPRDRKCFDCRSMKYLPVGDDKGNLRRDVGVWFYCVIKYSDLGRIGIYSTLVWTPAYVSSSFSIPFGDQGSKRFVISPKGNTDVHCKSTHFPPSFCTK